MDIERLEAFTLMSTPLIKHAKTAWKIFERLARESFVIRPSMPILYFGDSPRYFQSERRVVTVGLNPSFKEFQNDRGIFEIGFRFPLAPNMLANTTKEQDYENYLQSLNRYFETNPYWRWFRSLVPILNALGSEYRSSSNVSGCALHTDFCSPLATNPTWGKLSPRETNLLLSDGQTLWTDLVNDLSPDIMLVSLSKELRERIISRFVPEECFQDMFPRRPRKKVRIYKTRIHGRDCHITMGTTTTGNPFGALSNKEKQELGSRISAIAFR